MALIVGASPAKLFGLSGVERLDRSLRRLGIPRLLGGTDASRAPCDSVLLLRADHVFEEPLLAALAATPGIALHAPEEERPGALHVATADVEAASRILLAGETPPGLRRVEPADLAGAYNVQLRKRALPYLFRVTRDNARTVERRMFAASYKGVTDVINKYLLPRPALAVTRGAAALGLRPNHVTAIGLVLTVLTFWAFHEGHFGCGLVSGWVMSFLDTVDGKLARLTLTSSKIGDVFDHAIDLVHPPFWWWAWSVAVERELAWLDALGAIPLVLVGGYVAQRLQEGFFLKRFGIEIHIWRRFDSRFRLITTRRNPNLFILSGFSAAGEPDWGIVAVAGWTAASIAVHAVRIIQAALHGMAGRPIDSWLARP